MNMAKYVVFFFIYGVGLLQMASSNNLNHFSSNRAVLTIEKIPNVSIQAQNFNIPTITIGEAMQSSPRLNIPRPGDKAEFEDLMVDFILDENLEGWKEIQSWMVGIAAPEQGKQYDAKGQVSDGKIILYSAHNNPIMTLNFYDLWPTNLSEIAITEEDSETVFKKISVVFKYILYTID